MTEDTERPTLAYSTAARSMNAWWLGISIGLLVAVPLAIVLKMLDYDRTFAGGTYPLRGGVLLLVTGIVLFGPPLGVVAAGLAIHRARQRVLVITAIVLICVHGLLAFGAWTLFTIR